MFTVTSILEMLWTSILEVITSLMLPYLGLLLLLPRLVREYSFPYFSLHPSPNSCDCSDCLSERPMRTPFPRHTASFEEYRTFSRAYDAGEFDGGRGTFGRNPLHPVQTREELVALVEVGGDLELGFEVPRIRQRRLRRLLALDGVRRRERTRRGERLRVAREELAAMRVQTEALEARLGDDRFLEALKRGNDEARGVDEEGKRAVKIMQARINAQEKDKEREENRGKCKDCIAEAAESKRLEEEGVEEDDGGIELLVGIDGEFYSMVEGERKRYEPAIKWL